MPLSAHAVAAEIRRRVPHIGVQKLHKLLYYCQGHHLATFDEPLFEETISAWDRGPVVGQVWKLEQIQGVPDVEGGLTEAELNTVGYVLSRYGQLTGKDLEHLTHAETPWQLANARRPPGQSAKIQPDWIRDYFREGDCDDESPVLDADEVAKWLAGVQVPTTPGTVDTREALLARLSRA
jgi:uncharacterized phage-associated protein